MSRQPTQAKNGRKGAAIRRAGFKTSFHADAELKAFVDSHLREKKYSDVEIYRRGKLKFGERMPSFPAFRNYKKRHFQPGKITMALSPDEIMASSSLTKEVMSQRLADFNELEKLIELQEMQMNRLEMFIEREKTIKMPMKEVNKTVEEARNILTSIADVRHKQGVPSQVYNVNFNSQSNTYNHDESVSNSVTNQVVDFKTMSEIESYFNRMRIAAKEGEDERADSGTQEKSGNSQFSVLQQ